MKTSKPVMTEADFLVHQQKHGFTVLPTPAKSRATSPASTLSMIQGVKVAGGHSVVRHKAKKQTRVEVEMGLMLEYSKNSGQIKQYEFEGVTLKLGEGLRYTADFAVWENDNSLRLIETKGPFIRQDSLIKFKAACKQYPHIKFQIWQKNREGLWKQL